MTANAAAASSSCSVNYHGMSMVVFIYCTLQDRVMLVVVLTEQQAQRQSTGGNAKLAKRQPAELQDCESLQHDLMKT